MFYRTNAGDVVSNSADNLSNTDGSSSIPSIAVYGNNVYVVWRDNTPGSDEYFIEEVRMVELPLAVPLT